jgi:hypothetical protein
MPPKGWAKHLDEKSAKSTIEEKKLNRAVGIKI